MAALSTYYENKVLDHELRNVAWTSPTTVYLALYSSNPTAADVGTEITGGSYARQSIAFAAAVAGVTQNTAQLNFPIATADYPATVTHVGIRDALTGGNLLRFAALATPRTILTGYQFIMAIGQLVASLA